MKSEMAWILRMSMICIPLLFVTGIYCIITTRNLIRIIIGLELLTKGVTVLIIVAGYLSGHLALAQAMAITLIVIEVVVISVTAGIILNVYRQDESLDARIMQHLKG